MKNLIDNKTLALPDEHRPTLARRVFLGSLALLGGAAAWKAAPSFAGESAVVIAPPADDTPTAATATTTETAVLAGGCFWGVQGVFQHVKGVTNAVSGYAGGDEKTAKYEVIGSGRTGHAEAVRVTFDPKQISYGQILQIYFSVVHNPTELNRQGPDEGTDYRSIAFYRTPEEREILLNTIKEVNATKHYSDPIVTQVVPFKAFYPAEKYHQGYYRLHGDNPYISNVSEPKVMKFRKAMKAELKPEFQK